MVNLGCLRFHHALSSHVPTPAPRPTPGGPDTLGLASHLLWTPTTLCASPIPALTALGCDCLVMGLNPTGPAPLEDKAGGWSHHYVRNPV